MAILIYAPLPGDGPIRGAWLLSDRAIQQSALEIWQGKEANLSSVQKALLHRARCNRAARGGGYTVAMEKEWAWNTNLPRIESGFNRPRVRHRRGCVEH